jgi:hypothetical protein
MDMLDSPTIPDGSMTTKNGRPQQKDRRCFLLSQPDVIKGRQDAKRVSLLESEHRRRNAMEDSSEQAHKKDSRSWQC